MTGRVTDCRNDENGMETTADVRRKHRRRCEWLEDCRSVTTILGMRPGVVLDRGDRHASRCGEGATLETMTDGKSGRGRDAKTEPLTMTSLTKEMLEMVPSTQGKTGG